MNQYAIFGNYYVSDAGSGMPNIAPVGVAALGAGFWGQLDLAGNVSQWTLDWYAAYVDPCSDCAYLAEPMQPSARVIRGSLFDDDPTNLAVPLRNSQDPTDRDAYGIRCARSP
jgi:formylglycine-generating enzyme